MLCKEPANTKRKKSRSHLKTQLWMMSHCNQKVESPNLLTIDQIQFARKNLASCSQAPYFQPSSPIFSHNVALVPKLECTIPTTMSPTPIASESYPTMLIEANPISMCRRIKVPRASSIWKCCLTKVIT